MQFAGKLMEPENTEAAWAQNDKYHLFCLMQTLASHFNIYVLMWEWLGIGARKLERVL